uniref:Uncharacterized protein n=1 Tax=Romanomermis culicivorax TaxID=13658 RepID=A0A915HVY2_ROMCU
MQRFLTTDAATTVDTESAKLAALVAEMTDDCLDAGLWPLEPMAAVVADNICALPPVVVVATATACGVLSLKNSATQNMLCVFYGVAVPAAARKESTRALNSTILNG